MRMLLNRLLCAASCTQVSDAVVRVIEELEPTRQAIFEAQTAFGQTRWNEHLAVDLRLAGEALQTKHRVVTPFFSSLSASTSKKRQSTGWLTISPGCFQLGLCCGDGNNRVVATGMPVLGVHMQGFSP
jgi:hypothetical protein